MTSNIKHFRSGRTVRRSLCKLLLAVIILLPIQIQAQNALQKEADQLYQERAYYYAAEKYEHLLAKNSVYKNYSPVQIHEIKSNLASSYRLIRDTKNAEIVYADLVADSVPVAADEVYYYAAMLQANGKYAEALTQYSNYRTVEPYGRVSEVFVAQMEQIAGIAKKADRKNAVRAVPFNSEASDYSTAIWGNNIVFASTRGNKKVLHSQWSGEAFAELYLYNGQEVKRLPKKAVNTTLNEGAACFNDRGDVMYFTRNFYISGKEYNKGNNNYLAVLQSKLKNGKWTDGKKLQFNSPKFNCAHPSLSPDGTTLYFASDRPDGSGGMDIYRVGVSDDGFDLPENLGPAINTQGNEVFPFAKSADTLYFASDGHAGYGGLDIFCATLQNGQWTVENLHEPANSTQDDFAYVCLPYHKNSMATAYISSNRNGNDDIFQLRNKLVLQGITLDNHSRERINGVEIRVQAIGNSDDSRTYGGNSIIANLNTNYNYNLIASASGYFDEKMLLCDSIYAKAENDTVRIEVLMQKMLLKCVVFDDSTKQELPNVKIVLSGAKDSTVLTDASGSFNFFPDLAKSYTLHYSRTPYISKNVSIPASMFSNWNFHDTLKVYMNVDRGQDIYLNIAINDKLASKPLYGAKVLQYQHYINHAVFADSTGYNGMTAFRCSKAYVYEAVVNHNFFSTTTHTIDIEKQGLENGDTIVIDIIPPVIQGTIADAATQQPLPKVRAELFETDAIGELQITKTDGRYLFYLLPESRYAFDGVYPLHSTLKYYNTAKHKLYVKRIKQEVQTDKKYGFTSYLIKTDTLAIAAPTDTLQTEAGTWRYAYKDLDIALIFAQKPKDVPMPTIDLTSIYPDMVRNLGDYMGKGPDISQLFGNIYFDVDSDILHPETTVIFDSLARILTDDPELKLRITAFADSTGRIMHNIDLSKRRAVAAYSKLMEMGVSQSRMNMYYYGEEPMSNDCPDNDPACIDNRLQFSRRVEFKFERVMGMAKAAIQRE